MVSKYKLGSILMVLAAMLFAVGCSEDDNDPVAPTPQNSKIRVIHTSYDAPAVDIRVDGTVAVSNLAYGESSGYAEVPAERPKAGHFDYKGMDLDVAVDEFPIYVIHLDLLKEVECEGE